MVMFGRVGLAAYPFLRTPRTGDETGRKPNGVARITASGEVVEVVAAVYEGSSGREESAAPWFQRGSSTGNTPSFL